MFFTALYDCSVWSDNISAKHKFEVAGQRGEGTKERETMRFTDNHYQDATNSEKAGDRTIQYHDFHYNK